MSSKINQLLQQWPPRTVATPRWLSRKGVDRRLADKYVQSGWLERLGHGAYRRTGATVDWPGCSFYQELMEAYPEAKVLLSVRDPDRWYESMLTTIYRVPRSFLLFLLRPTLPFIRNLYRMVNAAVWGGTFGGRFEDREHAIGIFERHNEEVKKHVPPDRLLVYDVKQGWEPLCHFLDVPVPIDKAFPHLNDAARIQRFLRYGPWLVLSVYAGIVAAIVVLIRG